MTEFAYGLLGGVLGGAAGMVVGLLLGGRTATRQLRDELRANKWLREASRKDRNITRDAVNNSGRSRVKKARIRK